MIECNKDYFCALGMIFKRQYVAIFAGILLVYLVLTFHGVHDKLYVNSLKPSRLTEGLTNFVRMFKPNTTYSGSGDPVNVLILTYMRSGSSLTGDILQHSPGAFYVYEPFRPLGHKNESSFVIQYAKGTSRRPPFKFTEEAYHNLYSWFTCDIGNIPIVSLNDGFMQKSIKASMLKTCLSHMRGSMNSTTAMYMCARQLKSVCENSPFRVIKTIRLLLADVRNLLEDLPNLKIIHLVRDPRATLFSQSRLGQCSDKKGGRYGCTNKFCTRVENDVLEEERLMKKYPDRVMPVFYQDIAKEPLKTSQRLFDFIGAQLTTEAEEYIFNITMAGNPNNCAICTTRSNSSEHIDTWKQQMDPNFIKIVNERCNYVIKRYEFDEHPVQ